MALDLAQSYAAIVKSEKQSDGTLKVYGKATDDAIDIDQQICDADWLKRAMPDWFESGGNIREQHSNIASGVATEYEEKADGHYITALVVDPVSVKKVETGVLKGFSIGIRGPRVVRDTKAAGGRIVDGQIVEVSLVDRPANPNAKMVIAKAADGGSLEAVDQFSIPSPSELFAAKSDTPAIVEEPVEGETVSEEITTDAPVEDTPLEGVTVNEAPAEEVAEEAVEDASADEAPAEEPTPEAEIVNAAKSLLATVNKFSQADYDAAVQALGNLIIVEAEEMKQGHDERHSLAALLGAVHALADWYEGEVAEGEVPGEAVAELIEMSADAEKETEIVVCEECGEDEKMCKCMKAADAEKSATTILEVDEATVASIIEKAVATAKDSVANEITLLKSAQEAALLENEQLKTELATALTKTAAGGPKRSAAKTVAPEEVNALLAKAADFSYKAANTLDKTLAEGYRELAEDFKLKAATAAGKEA